MKKSILIAVLVATTIFTTSCSKDDAPEPITIESTLTTSKQAYQNASDGDWIEVTKEEYDNIVKELNQIQKIGLSDNDFISNNNDLIDGFKNYSLVNYSNGIIRLPKEAYIIGFKYISRTDNVRTNDQVKVSSNSSTTTGFINVGSKLPSHTGKGEHFFIIKNNTIKSSTIGYLGFYSSDKMGCKRNSFRVQYNSGNTDTLPNLWSGACYYQGLSTTQKQW